MVEELIYAGDEDKLIEEFIRERIETEAYSRLGRFLCQLIIRETCVVKPLEEGGCWCPSEFMEPRISELLINYCYLILM